MTGAASVYRRAAGAPGPGAVRNRPYQLVMSNVPYAATMTSRTNGLVESPFSGQIAVRGSQNTQNRRMMTMPLTVPQPDGGGGEIQAPLDVVRGDRIVDATTGLTYEVRDINDGQTEPIIRLLDVEVVEGAQPLP